MQKEISKRLTEEWYSFFLLLEILDHPSSSVISLISTKNAFNALVQYLSENSETTLSNSDNSREVHAIDSVATAKKEFVVSALDRIEPQKEEEELLDAPVHLYEIAVSSLRFRVQQLAVDSINEWIDLNRYDEIKRLYARLARYQGKDVHLNEHGDPLFKLELVHPAFPQESIQELKIILNVVEYLESYREKNKRWSGCIKLTATAYRKLFTKEDNSEFVYVLSTTKQFVQTLYLLQFMEVNGHQKIQELLEAASCLQHEWLDIKGLLDDFLDKAPDAAKKLETRAGTVSKIYDVIVASQSQSMSEGRAPK